MSGAALLALLLASAPDVFIAPVVPVLASAPAGLAVRKGEPARLTVVVAARDACWAGEAGTVFRGEPCLELPAAVQASSRWLLATASPRDYDNTRRCTPGEIARGCHEPIHYELVELEQLRGATGLDARDVPRLAAEGTHRLAVRLTWEGHELGSPGPRDAGEADALAPRMFELVTRRDDSYVGYLTELLGVPFVLGPGRLPGLGHQTDHRLGADCVALVIYGRRRLGEPRGYVAPAVLRQWTTLVGSAGALVGPVGRVADVGRVEAGDVLHFGFQSAVLSRDQPPLGRLDANDVVIHTFHGLAEEVRLGALPYGRHAVELRRWPGPPRGVQARRSRAPAPVAGARE